MNEHTDLKALERKAFTSYHQDGLIDIIVGSALFSLALMIWFFPGFWYFIVGGLVALTSTYTAAKKSVTVPRMGYVEFSPERKQKIIYIFLAFVVILVFGNILGILAMLFPPLGILIFESQITILIMGVIGGFLFALIGYISDLRRFYIYGTIFLASAVFIFFTPILVILPLLVVSIIMIMYGAILLYQFTQLYPKESGGEVEVV